MRTLFYISIGFGLVACSENSTGGLDAGALFDSQPADAPFDGGSLDALDAPDAQGATDGGPSDSSARDAMSPDADGTSDASSPLDPAFCPVGDDDGCCPLGLRYGGTDPDCASFACESLSRLPAPIILDPIVEASTARDELGTAALAFTGTDLAIAWTDIKRETAGATRTSVDYYFERRAISGELIGDVREGTVEGITGSQLTRGPARLEYDRDEDLFPFAFNTDNRSLATATLDRDGGLIASGYAGTICGGATAVVDLFDSREGFFSAYSNATCTGPSRLRINVFDSAMELLGGLSWTRHEDGVGPVGFFDPASRRVSWLSVETPMRRMQFRAIDVDDDLLFSGAGEVPATEIRGDNANPLAWAFDGERFMTVVASRQFMGSWQYPLAFRRINAASGEGESGGGTLLMPGRRPLHARIEWIGGGYLAAVTTVSHDGTSGNAPNEDADPRTHVFYRDASGGTRQLFDLSERNAMYPDIAWVGDRVAISWVETQADGRRFHMLDFFDCAE